MSGYLFEERGDVFVPTELTRGGWSDEAQHGSPPSGLLARAVEAVPTAVEMQTVRFTIDLFRPVPLTPLTVRTEVRRDGLRIQVVDTYLCAGDVEVGRASALKIRVGTFDLELPDETGEVMPPLDRAEPMSIEDAFGRSRLPRFHTHAVEIRTVDGSFFRPGMGESWFRLKVQVVAGEEPSPFVRLATLADMSNGNSQNLHPRRWIYVNPDITLYASRLPEGEWIGMRSIAHQHPSGIGLADTQVFDQRGPLGRINQAQLIEPRS